MSKPELSKTDLEEMKEWFYFFDKNNDKKLDRQELRSVFHALCWDLTDDEFEKVFKSADTDGNDYITYDEYLKLLEDFRKDPYTERLELIEAFRHFDKDRSGTIEKNELKRFLLSKDIVYGDRDSRQLDTLIAQADTNGDGVIDIEEFVDLMLQKPQIDLQKKV